jgi:uncharacterized membrane protein
MRDPDTSAVVHLLRVLDHCFEETPSMNARITLASHPLHPMLVSFPIAFYTTTVAAFAAYQATHDPFWFRAGAIANLAGVIGAAVAAVPGFVDWAVAIPGRTPAKRVGILHMVLNVIALVLFTCSSFGSFPQRAAPPADARVELLVTGAGLLCTLAAGWQGWNLVQKHHVGVTLSAEQLRADSREVEADDEPSVLHPISASAAARERDQAHTEVRKSTHQPM